MKKVLLEETKIGNDLVIGFEQDGDEVGLTICSFNAMTIYAMEVEAWRQFVRAVNRADVMQKLEELN